MGWITGDDFSSGNHKLKYRTPEQARIDQERNRDSLVKSYADELEKQSKKSCYWEKVIIDGEAFFTPIFRHDHDWAYVGCKLFPVMRHKVLHDYVLDTSRKISTVRDVILGE